MNQELIVKEQIRTVVSEHARLSVPIEELGDDSDLFQAGMTSHASVSLMLALEETFEVEFPEALIRKSTFQSVTSIEHALLELGGVAA